MCVYIYIYDFVVKLDLNFNLYHLLAVLILGNITNHPDLQLPQL